MRKTESASGTASPSCRTDAQQCDEAGLLKVVIVRQCLRDTALTHEIERGAVGQAPLLVSTARIEIESLPKLNRRLRDNFHIRI